MANQVLSVLLFAQDESAQKVIQAALLAQGLVADVVWAQDKSSYLRLLNDQKFDVILSSDAPQGMTWQEARAQASARDPIIPFLLLCLHSLPSDSNSPLTLGVTDYSLFSSLEKLARYDVVTHLPNRTYFYEVLKTMLHEVDRHGVFLALLVLDIDNFKEVNDALGHSFGDKLLQVVAKKIIENFEEAGYVAYLGGDEFAIVLESPGSQHEVANFCQRLLHVLSEPVFIEGHEIHSSASLGVALYPNAGLTEELLIKNADAAMYKAKALGKNTYQFYTEALNQENSRRLLIDQHSRHAIQRGEFSLVYQPIISFQAKKTIGIEVLVRWHDEALGEISPEEFIPIFESTGFVVEMGEWVIKEAFSAYKELLRLEPKLFLNINCSVLQLHQSHFVSFIETAIEKAGLSGQDIFFEITETILMEDIDRSFHAMKAIDELGIRFVIDDFGVGYSSLNYIRRLPISALKLDKSFVQALPMDTNDVAITEAILKMAEALNLKVIAEGVEQKDQAECLKALGCDYAQGYLYSRPMSFDQLKQHFLEKPE